MNEGGARYEVVEPVVRQFQEWFFRNMDNMDEVHDGLQYTATSSLSSAPAAHTTKKNA